ncbi:MAG: translation initiation factor IF-2 N-terminal domain-containing protein [Acidimicrobiia bacterium]|nr:translation initiation factor IF-2 N-terminal domain-containing protein [Acidimicrobiia bacterium]
MAIKKIRVYELARELGVENKVVLELSEELRIGVKSHSSSIEEPQADRVRRLADSKGLRREPEPEKKPAKKKAPAKKKVVSARSTIRKAPEAKPEPASATAPKPEAEPSATAATSTEPTPDRGSRCTHPRGRIGIARPSQGPFHARRRRAGGRGSR